MLKKSNENIVVVGGFPHPIGGVTTFISRLVSAEDRVKMVIDLYPNKVKRIPNLFAGRFVHSSSRIGAYLLLIWNIFTVRNCVVHFNFSTASSLIVFLLLIKGYSNRWLLMLHHGELHSNLPRFLVRILLSRFDCILYMNSTQKEFYLNYGVANNQLLPMSSYVVPSQPSPYPDFSLEIDQLLSKCPTLIASGYPASYYNHDWCIRFVVENPEYQLLLFLYGDGSEVSSLSELAKSYPNVNVFWNQSEDNFNYALSRAFAYIRPTSKDSFGISVADAVSFGTPVLASNVCARYPGALTFIFSDYHSFACALLKCISDGFSQGQSLESVPCMFSYDAVLNHLLL